MSYFVGVGSAYKIKNSPFNISSVELQTVGDMLWLKIIGEMKVQGDISLKTEDIYDFIKDVDLTIKEFLVPLSWVNPHYYLTAEAEDFYKNLFKEEDTVKILNHKEYNEYLDYDDLDIDIIKGRLADTYYNHGKEFITTDFDGKFVCSDCGTLGEYAKMYINEPFIIDYIFKTVHDNTYTYVAYFNGEELGQYSDPNIARRLVKDKIDKCIRQVRLDLVDFKTSYVEVRRESMIGGKGKMKEVFFGWSYLSEDDREYREYNGA